VTENGGAATSVDGGEHKPVAAPIAHEVAAGAATHSADRPELPVAVAFASGFVLAMILRRAVR
jgi:hypothetical protein